MASFLGLGLFDPDEADEPVGFSDNLDDYTFDSIEGATKSSKHASSRPKPVPEHSANVLDFEVLMLEKSQLHFQIKKWKNQTYNWHV